MDNVNARLVVRTERLNFPLPTLFARRFCAFRALVDRAPDDVSGVFLRLVAVDGSYRDFLAVRLSGRGQWRVSVPAAAFAEAGGLSYELVGEDDSGERVALGAGRVEVADFSAGGASPAEGATVAVAQMPVRGGGFVNCVAVMDSAGEWTYEFIPAEGEA